MGKSRKWWNKGPDLLYIPNLVQNRKRGQFLLSCSAPLLAAPRGLDGSLLMVMLIDRIDDLCVD